MAPQVPAKVGGLNGLLIDQLARSSVTTSAKVHTPLSDLTFRLRN
jgi:hypothetical protein